MKDTKPPIILSTFLLDIFELVFDNYSHMDNKTFQELENLRDNIVSFKISISKKDKKTIDSFVENTTKEIKRYKHLYSNQTNSILGADMTKINEILSFKIKY